MSFLRLYGVAGWCALFAGLRFAGIGNDLLAGIFLGILAVLVVVAEKERQRLVRRNRDGYRRRGDDR